MGYGLRLIVWSNGFVFVIGIAVRHLVIDDLFERIHNIVLYFT